MESARRFLDGLHRVECLVAVAAFSFIALILLADTLGRELFSQGVFGAQRYAVFALVIGAYMGLGIATATGSHLRPRFADSWLPAAWGPAVDRVADLVTGLFLTGVAAAAAMFVLQSIEVEERTMVLDWLVWPFQLAIPLGFLSAAIRYFFFAAYPVLRPKPAEGQE
ncbi:TRAP transporter small permease [Desertibaculum subflavum]|uniref:TRAP transporter small permease n=1 Tax=Desertibaculum subflavum TaxID=2268458 RepID=UPI000E673D51